MTWEERRTKWRLRKIAVNEKIRERKVKVGQVRILIEGVWWKWNKEKEEMRDGKGRKYKG